MDFHPIPEQLIKKAISGQQGSPDWSAILNIISKLEGNASAMNLLLESMARYIQKGPNSAKYNTLLLLDALFKNGKKPQLSKLQCDFLYQTLSDSSVSDDPKLQNFVHENVSEWVKACATNDCLDDKFVQWQKTNGSYRFIEGLTSDMRAKFIEQFDTCAEMITIFSQFLISAYLDKTGVSTPVIKEILPNIREIELRTEKLLPTFKDFQMKSYCSAIYNFASVTVEFHDAMKKEKSFDISRVIKALKNVQKIAPQPQGVEVVPEVQEKKPLRTAGDDITDEEFFIELHKLKKPVAVVSNDPVDLLGLSAPAAQPKVDNLLLF